MTTRRARGLHVAAGVLGIGILLVGPSPAGAQSSWLTGYLQTVPLFAGPTIFSNASASAFNRLRLSTEPVFGPLALEIAYDHAMAWAAWARSQGAASGSICRGPPSSRTTSTGSIGWTASTWRGSRTRRSS